MTFMTTSEEVRILKRDVMGRVTMPREKREELLDEFEKSGMPAYRFAQVHGIKEMTFANWVQKRKRARGEYKPRKKRSGSSGQIALVEAVVEQKPEAIKVELPNGAKVEIINRSQLALAAELISILGK